MISLVNPRSPFLETDAVMPPLGIFYLVAVLKEAGIEAQAIDLGLNESIPDGPVYITGTTPQYEEMLKIRRKYSVVGGPHASISPQTLSQEFDCVVVGEGEKVIEKIVREKSTGIIYAPRIKNLDEIPFPDRSTAHKYSYKINRIPATSMITSRGCTGRCAFCCKAVMHNGIYLRSVPNILDEIAIIKYFGFNAVMFYDDSIAINKKRLIELCTGIKRHNMTWRCFVRSDQVDHELFERMADAGCYEVLIGVESGSNRILKNIHKEETAEQHKRAIWTAQQSGINVKALMIVGLPGENFESLSDSKDFILESRPDSLDVTILSVYQGCDIYNHPERYELTFTDPLWYKGRQDEYRSSVSTPELTPQEIILARNWLWETFLSTK